MGFINRRSIAGAIQQYRDLRSTIPHWARITGIGRKVGPFISLRLEIHSGRQPPFEVTTTDWPPRGVIPRIGQDVAFRVSVSDDHTHYAIDWNSPPRYGTEPPPEVPPDARI